MPIQQDGRNAPLRAVYYRITLNLNYRLYRFDPRFDFIFLNENLSEASYSYSESDMLVGLPMAQGADWIFGLRYMYIPHTVTMHVSCSTDTSKLYLQS
jgi:hypothetical protein